MKKQVVHLDTGLEWRGGQRQVMLLMEGQRRQGWQTHLLAAPGSRLAQAAIQAGFDITLVAMRGEWDILAAFRIRSILKELTPAVVHAHSAHAHTLMVVAAWRLPVVRVVHRRVDFVPSDHILNRIKYCSSGVSYICVSQCILEILSQFGVPRSRLTAVRSAVPPPLMNPGGPTREGVDPNHVRMGVIGALVPHKGHEDVIRALRYLHLRWPNVELEFLGEGCERRRLGTLVEDLGLKAAIHFTGEVKDVWERARTWQVLLVPSRQEGLNTSILDAMWRKLPVIATRAGGILELLDTTCAILVEPSQPESLASAMEAHLADPAASARRAERAHERVIHFPSPDDAAARVIEHYLHELSPK